MRAFWFRVQSKRQKKKMRTEKWLQETHQTNKKSQNVINLFWFHVSRIRDLMDDQISEMNQFDLQKTLICKYMNLYLKWTLERN